MQNAYHRKKIPILRGTALRPILLHFNSSADKFFPWCSLVMGLAHLMFPSIKIL